MIYLDNASTTYPKPESVYKAMDKFLRELGVSPGRGGYESAVQVGRIISDTRTRIANFFGGDFPEKLIFALNTTDALNIAIKGTLKKGDNVITTHLEHNSISRPLKRLEDSGFITVTKVDSPPDGFIDPDDIKKAINKNTKLVAITHASNVTGVIQPIGEIGRTIKEVNDKVLFLVDCAQTAGVCDINVKKFCIDLLAFPGHKALFGPPGTGGLYVNGDIILSPWREGGTGVDSIAPTQPTNMPFWLEAGTPNTVGIIGLNEGLKFVIEKGINTIFEHESNLVAHMISHLKNDDRFIIYGSKDAKKHVGCLSVNIKGMKPQEVEVGIDKLAGIAVRTGLQCAPYVHRKIGSFPDGTVRLSPGIFNTEEDVNIALTSLKQIADRKK
ncbi:MAG: aminotransferase class V-fold PLP-dependent enzyme [bacterium]